MARKNKSIVFIAMMMLIIFLPISSFTVKAEEKNKENENIDENEIIKREDEDTEKNLPSVPSEEEVFGDEEIVDIEVQTPASVTGEKMEGAGTVVDFTTTGERAFYTIVDNDNNTFYLIIDMDKSHNNVYFLSEVNQAELTANAENNMNNILSQEDEVQNKEDENEEAQEVTAEKQKDREEKGSNNIGFLIGVLAIGLTGVLAYHFTKQKKKTKEAENEDEDHFDEMDNYEDDFMSFDETDNEESAHVEQTKEGN